MSRTKEQAYEKFWHEVVADVFKVSLVTYIAFFLADVFHPGLVSNYINLHYVLALIAAAGVITAMVAPDGFKPRLRARHFMLAALLGTLALLAAYIQAVFLLAWAIPVAVIAGLVVFFLIISIFSSQ